MTYLARPAYVVRLQVFQDKNEFYKAKADDFLRSLILFHHRKVDQKAFCFVECCGVKKGAERLD